MTTDDLVIYVYKGEWGLPSIDFDCLRVLVRMNIFFSGLVIS